MKTLLIRMVEVITFLFGAFGHFLTRIAPPDSTGLSFAVGFSSMTCLCILLMISLISKGMADKKRKKFWLWPAIVFLAIALGSGVFYWQNFHRLTYPYPQDQPEGRHLSGTQFSAKALKNLAENPGQTTAELVADFGGPSENAKVWTPYSIEKAENTLTLNYILLVISLSTAIFCLLEGLLLKKQV